MAKASDHDGQAGQTLAKAGATGAFVAAIVLVGFGGLLLHSILGAEVDAHTTTRTIVAAVLILLGAAIPPTLAVLALLFAIARANEPIAEELLELRRAVLGLPSESNAGALWTVVEAWRKETAGIDSTLDEQIQKLPAGYDREAFAKTMLGLGELFGPNLFYSAEQIGKHADEGAKFLRSMAQTSHRLKGLQALALVARGAEDTQLPEPVRERLQLCSIFLISGQYERASALLDEIAAAWETPTSHG